MEPQDERNWDAEIKDAELDTEPKGDGFYTCRTCGNRLLEGEQVFCKDHQEDNLEDIL